MNKDVVKNSIICLSNMKIEDTTYEIARDIVLEEYEEKDKEIERLNNIIDELEKYIEENIKITKQALKFEGLDDFDKKKYSRDITLFEMILDKLKELKEGK